MIGRLDYPPSSSRWSRSSIAAAAALASLACSGGGGSESDPVVTTVAVAVDASAVTGTLSPLWRDHYDLSVEHEDYWAEPGMLALAQSLAPRSWRCSVGRWEIGFAPPSGGDDTDPAVLRAVEREFYRGPNTLAGADDPSSYDFAYLDLQLAAIALAGAEPFLCFDYMPFALSAEQDPFNANNLGLADPSLSFCNGIRTAPPADPAVYARVVRNAVRHVRGLFAGATDFGVEYVEIGNEPDLVDGSGTVSRYFWTGTRPQWLAMYAAIAAEIDGDPALTNIVKLGGGSFAFQPFEPSPWFAQDFLVDVAVNGRRLDFVSYHSYDDDPAAHLLALARLRNLLSALSLSPEVVNGEWGRALGGVDPVYDRIEHGLFRAQTIAYFEVLGVRIAHESLFRDPLPLDGLLGLVKTGPPARKPAADAMLALGMLDGALDALAITIPNGEFTFAGRNSAGTRVVVVYVGDDPGADAVTEFELSITGLPWGAAAFDARRYVVSEATASAGDAVKLVETELDLSGGAYSSRVRFGPGPGAGRMLVWELVGS